LGRETRTWRNGERAGRWCGVETAGLGFRKMEVFRGGFEEWTLVGAGLGRFRFVGGGKWKLPSVVGEAAAMPRRLRYYYFLLYVCMVCMYCCLCVMLGLGVADWHTPV
jgi:hypothetical protein